MCSIHHVCYAHQTYKIIIRSSFSFFERKKEKVIYKISFILYYFAFSHTYIYARCASQAKPSSGATASKMLYILTLGCLLYYY